MITASNITFKRGDTTIFEALSFVVHTGQKVGVVGRNGAGKSTLLKIPDPILETTEGKLLRKK